ncbi:hypothetical protein ACIQAC_26310 [Streptomyces sp. NPDC088387]|uniref:hypothetical protein n=1 Tax=Streptomyces sp. NPDC088387 TaxID=3365859 RepID=UPI00380815B5
MRQRGRWRPVLIAWTTTVLIASGLTLWLQDSVEQPDPPDPHVREESSPTPTGYPPCAPPTPEENTAYACLFRSD